MDSIEKEVLIERVKGEFAKFVPGGVEPDKVLVEVISSLLYLFRKERGGVGLKGLVRIGRHDDTVKWFKERSTRFKVVRDVVGVENFLRSF